MGSERGERGREGRVRGSVGKKAVCLYAAFGHTSACFPTHSLPHFLAYLFTHSLVFTLTHSLTHPLTPSHTHSVWAHWYGRSRTARQRSSLTLSPPACSPTMRGSETYPVLVCPHAQFHDPMFQFQCFHTAGLKTVIAEFAKTPRGVVANASRNITGRLVEAITRQVSGVRVNTCCTHTHALIHPPPLPTHTHSHTHTHTQDLNQYVLLEALDILSDLIRSYGNSLSSFHEPLVKALMPLLVDPRPVSVRKRAYTVLCECVCVCVCVCVFVCVQS